MDRIKMYYSNIDTTPRILINHFVRYLGFYIEDITRGTVISDVESLVDIYIISDAYVSENSMEIDIHEDSKTILIYLDGWEADAIQEIRSIIYDGQTDLQFLTQLSDHMTDILSMYKDINRRLIGSVRDLKSFLDKFIELFVDNNVLQVTLFARCFNAHHDFYAYAQERYLNFISQIKQTYAENEENALLKYIDIMSRCEMDMICKVNSYALYYEPDQLQDDCNELMKQYTENEELRIMHADIGFMFDVFQNKSGNEYSDIRLTDCVYAYFQRGNIWLEFMKNPGEALGMYRAAAMCKGDYYYAWFQIGKCYEERMEYIEAINAYEKVCEILAGRYHAHVLAPLEIVYFYDAVIQIIDINRINVRNYNLAQSYEKLAENVWNEICRPEYFKLVWGDDAAFKRFFPMICEEIKNKLSVNM